MPLIADSSIDMEQMLKDIVGNGDEDDMEANNDQCADGKIGHDGWFVRVK